MPDAQPPPHTAVTRHNLLAYRERIIDALLDPRLAAIAIDCEFTGLGENVANTRDSNLDTRYHALRTVVDTHAMLSFGLAVFRMDDSDCTSVNVAGDVPLRPTKKARRRRRQAAAVDGSTSIVAPSTAAPSTSSSSTSSPTSSSSTSTPTSSSSTSTPTSSPAAAAVTAVKFTARTFDFAVSCQRPFVVSPSSLRFLVVDSGFDFNRQVRVGIPCLMEGGIAGGASPGASTTKPVNKSRRQAAGAATTDAVDAPLEQAMHDIFLAILTASHRHRTPVVVHNGLLDLMFIYRTFYGPLPAHVQTFVADLTEMFPGGLYDTKYTSDYVTRESASFLAYLYGKYERKHGHSTGVARSVGHRLCCTVELPLQEVPLSADDVAAHAQIPSSICNQYANHGFCPLATACPQSHDIDAILDREEGKPLHLSSHNSHRTRASPFVDAAMSTAAVQSTHTAFFDAYMTGYVFLHQTLRAWASTSGGRRASDGASSLASAVHGALAEFRNRLYLIGKPIPLLLSKSAFTQSSKHHQEKMAFLREREAVLASVESEFVAEKNDEEKAGK